MPSTLKPQNTPLISSLPAPKQEIKLCFQRESNFFVQGEDASKEAERLGNRDSHILRGSN